MNDDNIAITVREGERERWSIAMWCTQCAHCNQMSHSLLHSGWMCLWECARTIAAKERMAQPFHLFSDRRQLKAARSHSLSLTHAQSLSFTFPSFYMEFCEIQFSLFALDGRKWIVVEHMHKIHWSTLLILGTFIVHHLNINSNLWHNQCAANERVMLTRSILSPATAFSVWITAGAVAFGYESIGQKWHGTSHCNSFAFRFYSIYVTIRSVVCLCFVCQLRNCTAMQCLHVSLYLVVYVLVK